MSVVFVVRRARVVGWFLQSADVRAAGLADRGTEAGRGRLLLLCCFLSDLLTTSCPTTS